MSIENRVYIIDVNALEDEARFRYWYDKMPDFRKEKIDRMKPPASKRLSLGAGILLYEGLDRLGINPQKVKLRLGENEKPYLDGYDNVFFNLSHSGNIAVAAFSDKEVGIDVERIKTFKKSLAEYVFDATEISSAKRIAETGIDIDESIEEGNVKKDSFYTGLWTLKESLMKYNGKGISMNPKKIVFDGKVVFYEGKMLEEIHFTGFEYEDYHISVCSQYRDFCEKMTIVNC